MFIYGGFKSLGESLSTETETPGDCGMPHLKKKNLVW